MLNSDLDSFFRSLEKRMPRQLPRITFGVTLTTDGRQKLEDMAGKLDVNDESDVIRFALCELHEKLYPGDTNPFSPNYDDGNPS